MYRLSERISDSPFHGGPWEELGCVRDNDTLNNVLGAYQDDGYELFSFKKNNFSETYVFVHPDTPVLTNPIKKDPFGLNNPPAEILMFKHIIVRQEPEAYDTLEDYASDSAC